MTDSKGEMTCYQQGEKGLSCSAESQASSESEEMSAWRLILCCQFLVWNPLKLSFFLIAVANCSLKMVNKEGERDPKFQAPIDNCCLLCIATTITKQYICLKLSDSWETSVWPVGFLIIKHWYSFHPVTLSPVHHKQHPCQVIIIIMPLWGIEQHKIVIKWADSQRKCIHYRVLQDCVVNRLFN